MTAFPGTTPAPGADRHAPGADRHEGIEPVRDPRVTLVELVDTLLDRGLYLNLDVIISVADIPLIGLNLRATLAGMETMLEYGMMRDWDQRTREWVQRTAARDLPLEDGEELLSKTPGGYFSDDGFHRDWRPGGVYLTTHRLLVFRRDPREVLWQAPLHSIRTLAVRKETTIGGETLERLHLTVDDGPEAVLSSSSPRRLREMVLQQAPSARRALDVHPERRAEDERDGTAALVQGHLWFREDRAGRTAWRGGTGRLDEDGFTWQSAMDARPAIRLASGELRAISRGAGPAPFDDVTVIQLTTPTGEVVLAGDPKRWEPALGSLVRRPTTGGSPSASEPKEAADGPADR